MCKAAELVKTQTRDLQEGRSVDIVKKKDKTNSVKNEGDKVKQSDSEYLCKRCNKKHKPKSCPAYGKICINCGKYSSEWNFEIITSSPNYPRSNGLAERAVQTAKQMLKKCFCDNKEYRNSPIIGLGATPSQLLMSRITRTKIPIAKSLLKPKVESNIEPKLLKNQDIYKMYHDQHVKERDSFKPGQDVVINNGDGWKSAKILRPADTPRSYNVLNENGREVRRNSLHIRKSLNQYSPKPISNNCDFASAHKKVIKSIFTKAN
ncbi:hypothetical protein QE152_g4828 [Popillia japonica]|uniref:Integrase catalytic domain-containing protein n=1 Tax=Popillia japonica TaxID=7064 RepID=A0AAW1MZ49_POPJA